MSANHNSRNADDAARFNRYKAEFRSARLTHEREERRNERLRAAAPLADALSSWNGSETPFASALRRSLGEL